MNNVTAQLTQLEFNKFVLECAHKGWLLDQIAIMQLLNDMSERQGLSFDKENYEIIINNGD